MTHRNDYIISHGIIAIKFYHYLIILLYHYITIYKKLELKHQPVFITKFRINMDINLHTESDGTPLEDLLILQHEK